MTNTDAQTTETTTETLTAEQRTLAAQLNERVKNLDVQGVLSAIAQARDLREIRDSELYRAIEKPSGGEYQNFGEYITDVSTKSPSTISQNISVVTAFSQYSDDQLAQAGLEKLDITRKMLGEGYYKTTDEALAAAIKRSRSELIDIRKSSGEPQVHTTPLSSRKVVKALATRFEEGFQKFSAIYAQVHSDPANSPTDSQVTEFYLDVVNGLPESFLLEAASGQGGAAPEMAGGFTPKDVPVADVVYFLAEQLAEQGRDPEDILDQLREGVQSVQDRYEVQKREQAEQARAQEKAEKEAAKVTEKMVNKLQGAKPGQIIVFGDGAEAEVLDTSADTGEGIKGIFLKGLKDGQRDIFDEKGAQYNIEDVAAKGIVEVKKAPPAPKEKKAKETKAVKEEAPTQTLGISKSQQANSGKGKKPKASKPKQEEATV